MTEKEIDARLKLLERKHAMLTKLKCYRELQRQMDASTPALLRRQAE